MTVQFVTSLQGIASLFDGQELIHEFQQHQHQVTEIPSTESLSSEGHTRKEQQTQQASETPSNTVEINIQPGIQEDTYSIRFEQNGNVNELVIKIIDQKTEEVIKQLPPEALLALAEHLQELQQIYFPQQADNAEEEIMAIQFTGLASGMDTGSIVDQLMEIERAPINRLEADRTWQEARLAAFTEFNAQLEALQTQTSTLGDSELLQQRAIYQSNSEQFTASVDQDAIIGSSYQVEVLSLAQVQKSVSEDGYASRYSSDFGTGSITVMVGDEEHTIEFDADSDTSLDGIKEAINDANLGITASIINDGSADGNVYRLMLTGEDTSESFSLDTSGLSGGEDTLGNFNLAHNQVTTSDSTFAATTEVIGTGTVSLGVGDEGDSYEITIDNSNNTLEGLVEAINDADTGVTAELINTGDDVTPAYQISLTGSDGESFTLDTSSLVGGTALGTFTNQSEAAGIDNAAVQEAARAHIKMDGIDIYSDSNTVSDAMPGVTLNLLDAEEGATSTINVSLDEDAIKAAMDGFVSAYNGIMSFVTSQSVIEGEGGGLLAGDSGMNTIKRRLQNMLTDTFQNSGSYSTISQLGLETQRDGTLVLDSTVFNKAISDNLESVVKVLAGEDGGEGGVIQKFDDYLTAQLDSSTGMLAARKTSIKNSTDRIDNQIELLESRMETRQSTLEAQYAAMEQTISSLNTEGDYLLAQLSTISSFYNNKDD